MKHISIWICILFLTAGCSSPKTGISEAEAKEIVLDQHSGSIGRVEIISVSLDSDTYKVKWKNTENCEKGTDYIDRGSGKIMKGEGSIC
ncbi:hypothetical protein CEF21_07100 [Bacillus sp. FJAT-42376]|uniref:hypothetical protein n=1 Tax=Bacillus sp. FJAT-42376 TaxID=2014076 RepID=UPI000F51258F|nr:hypothetical protein [Bacillus sp. FJAT-42376]AZB42074.1 hypothetical protein CEF21_07100 [Bacillus sp. FJAT-42376]